MAGEIAAYLTFPAERIVVAPLGVAAPFGAAGNRHALPDGRPYVLHVGAHDRRKNVDTLIARAPALLPPGAVVADARTDEQLAELYRGARLVAVPSLDEGFGLPLLEALACGAPAVASRIAALPEIGGSAVAWIDEPRNVAAWSDSLARLVDQPEVAAAFAARGPAQAAAFTWERCAKLTLEVLRMTADERTRGRAASGSTPF